MALHVGQTQRRAVGRTGDDALPLACTHPPHALFSPPGVCAPAAGALGYVPTSLCPWRRLGFSGPPELALN